MNSFEVVQLSGLSPFSYCYFCLKRMKPGQEVVAVSIPIHFRWGKQRKKAKGNINHTHVCHKECK